MVSSEEVIYVAGHTGLVGSALIRELKNRGYCRLLTRTHAELELTDPIAVRSFFESTQPTIVFLAAARVGGIWANAHYPAEFIQQNLQIQNNIITAAYQVGVKRLLFLGSSCIYPRDCAQPIKEEYLLTGPLEPTNRPYALAKIAGIEMCWAFNRQYHTQYLAIMPTNLYGPGDNYDLHTSHVIPALIRKMHEAKEKGMSHLKVWGTGKPRREFLYSDDLAQACVFLMELPQESFDRLTSQIDHPPLVNIGCGKDLTISELATYIAMVVGFKGAIRFDPTRPDGPPRKLLDIHKITELGWKPNRTLYEGLQSTYAFFKQYNHNRESV